MAKRDLDVHLSATADRVRFAAGLVFRDLHWSVEEHDEMLSAREDAARLCCRAAPVTVEMLVRPEVEGSRLLLMGQVAGFGPLAKQSLTCLEGIASRIRDRAEATGQSHAMPAAINAARWPAEGR